ncbi:hypothetical protein [Flavobacterium panici]|uniref:HNH endonuclease n=1 Tax=Flavobacterium panici TaxID=2654843 RepID=A0A9N8J1C7_9FLAO|nr:hypothetical protein [Flavobacterium panici]CAC9974436.1 hypothetical protein FLAPXU55_02133 [Flavobacterium panici]
MIYLDPTNKKFKDALDIHYTKLLGEIKARIVVHADPAVTLFLTDDNLKVILKGRPDELINIQMLFLSTVVAGYNFPEWSSYFKIKRKPVASRLANEIAVLAKYGSVYNQLNLIFDYDKFSSKKNRIYSTYDLAHKLNINTCTYCNRMYTKTVIKPQKLTRPEFDHWFAKSRYPLLALSFYNLIPSCNICNSSIKGSTEMTLATHLHPYVDKPEFKFTYYNKSFDTYGFDIRSIAGSKSFNTVAAFKMKEIYEMHEDEIEDLRKIKSAYSESYLTILASQFKGLSISEDEMYRLAFGTYNDEEFFDKRPLSRMKRDILLELGIIKKK